MGNAAGDPSHGLQVWVASVVLQGSVSQAAVIGRGFFGMRAHLEGRHSGTKVIHVCFVHLSWPRYAPDLLQFPNRKSKIIIVDRKDADCRFLFGKSRQGKRAS